MSKSPQSYLSSRWNSTKYATHQDGPIRCLGRGRCRYSYCDGDSGFPPTSAGELCPWESEFASRLGVWFREEWKLLTVLSEVEDFDRLVSEFVNINLQRSRAMSRLNDSWRLRTGHEGRNPEAEREFDLADLYLNRLSGRQDRLDEELEARLTQLRERTDRMRPHMQAIELMILGQQLAANEARMPRKPIWDEFADGPQD